MDFSDLKNFANSKLKAENLQKFFSEQFSTKNTNKYLSKNENKLSQNFRAIDLIEFDNRFEPAMNHIFGNVLVCSDLDVANKVRSMIFRLRQPCRVASLMILFMFVDAISKNLICQNCNPNFWLWAVSGQP